jgi:MFS family permease
MAPQQPHAVPVRVQAAVYATALFSGNLFHIGSVILPLWALMLNPSPIMIGIFLGARQILPVLLSIHGGAMMDRFGARRVILIVGLLSAVTMALFPAMPWFGAAIVLQMLNGLAESNNWIGAQTLVGQIMRGHPVYTGRMMFVMRLGGFAGPPAVGLAWDLLGSTGAFMMVTAWITCGWVAALFLPKDTATAGRPTPVRAMKLSDALPRLSDYIDTFRLLALPAALLVVASTVVRQAGSGVQASFYVIYLESIGISGIGIGSLLGLSAAFSAMASLGVAPSQRFIRSHWLLMIMVAVSIVTIAITPLLGSYMLLAVAIGVRGVSQGFNLPLLLSIGLRAVEPEDQGKMVALRITINRCASAIIPIAMGGLAELVGIANSFYVLGVLGLVAIAMVSFGILRTPAFRDHE